LRAEEEERHLDWLSQVSTWPEKCARKFEIYFADFHVSARNEEKCTNNFLRLHLLVWLLCRSLPSMKAGIHPIHSSLSSSQNKMALLAIPIDHVSVTRITNVRTIGNTTYDKILWRETPFPVKLKLIIFRHWSRTGSRETKIPCRVAASKPQGHRTLVY
jgi:hypothetical protein